ncbi:MAG: tRNA (cytidine(34)-2'-O)-methyltransferase [Phycisphaerae bacterium]
MNMQHLSPAHRLKIVLIEPEIPQNTGNIARLCAVTGAQLHLVRPLGFFLTSKHLKRAGLDYWDKVDLHIHDSISLFQGMLADQSYWLCSSKGNTPLWKTPFQPSDWLIFGKETAGLPPDWLAQKPEKTVQIPMVPEARCLNISVAAGIVLFEALRQTQYDK